MYRSGHWKEQAYNKIQDSKIRKKRYNKQEKTCKLATMVLIRTGQGIIEITGTMAGNTFTKDKSGHHIRAKPRRVKQRTTAQNNQRKAFMRARNYSKDPRTVSYNIYRALNNLPMETPPPDYQIPYL